MLGGFSILKYHFNGKGKWQKEATKGSKKYSRQKKTQGRLTDQATESGSNMYVH